MANHAASDVALWFLSRNRMAIIDEGAEYISNLKLQKLLYYAQGCFLALKDEPLFIDDIVAWMHGPVVESIYHKYKVYGSHGIVYEDDFDASIFTTEEEDILEEVYTLFGQYSAWKLRNMTHDEYPWKSTPLNSVIPPEIIKEFFRKEYIA